MAFRAFEGPDFRFDSLTVDGGPLAVQLVAWIARASAAGRVPCVYLTAGWCPPSVKLERTLTDPQMQRALREVEAATLDVDAWGDQLGAAGFSARSIPAFFAVDAQGQPTATVTGAAWGENTPENMAPPLERFFDGLRAARTSDLRSEREPVAVPSTMPPLIPATPSRVRAIVMVIGALLLLVAGAWLTVSYGEQQQREQDGKEREERIRQDVQKSIQESLHKK